MRLLVKEGAHVKVVMTPSAEEFITSLTLATLSKNPVLTELVGGTGRRAGPDRSLPIVESTYSHVPHNSEQQS